MAGDSKATLVPKSTFRKTKTLARHLPPFSSRLNVTGPWPGNSTERKATPAFSYYCGCAPISPRSSPTKIHLGCLDGPVFTCACLRLLEPLVACPAKKWLQHELRLATAPASCPFVSHPAPTKWRNQWLDAPLLPQPTHPRILSQLAQRVPGQAAERDP